MDRHLVDLDDISPGELRGLLRLARNVKENPDRFSGLLKGKELAMIFQKTSTRTRVSFEAGMHRLGGNAIYLDWQTTNFTRASLEDEVRSLCRYVDVIMARVFTHADVVAMAEAATVPVINGLSDLAHPCQALGDMLTIGERFEDLSTITVAFIGDGNNNVVRSLVKVCSMLAVPLRVIAPEGFQPGADMDSWLEARNATRLVTTTRDVQAGVRGVDVLYTDAHVSMGQEKDEARRHEVLMPYKLTMDVLRATGKDSLVMHCLPAHRGVEIAPEVLDSPASIVFDQAENRMHAQNALLLWLLGACELEP